LRGALPPHQPGTRHAQRREKLAAAAGPAERARITELYRLTLLYEIAFWEMASTAEGWPGVEDDLASHATGPRWNPDVQATLEGAWSHMDRPARPDEGV
jgi:hypothetical protein